MQRSLPAYGSGIVALFALHFATFATLCPQIARGFENSLETVEINATSTLGVRVEPQNRILQSEVLNFTSHRIAAKTRKTTKKQSPAKTPPFIKWVSPRITSTDSDSRADVTDRSQPAQARVQVARRIRPARSAPTPRPVQHRIAKATKLPKPRVLELPTEARNDPTPRLEFPANPTLSTPTDLPPLTKSQQQLRTKIRRVLTDYYNRPLNTRDRSPWELLHAVLSFETHSKVLQGGPNGKPITAVGWLCFNQACRKRTLMYVNDEGNLQVRVGPALQGHRGQLLAMLAQAKVKPDYPMRIEKQDFAVYDLIEMEKRTCYPRTELTFKLIGLSHYLESDATWMNDQGMQWNIPKLISEEIRQPVRGAACGGTHRLAGLTLAYKNRLKQGGSVDGQYLKAKKFVTRYQQYAYKLQNRDGSFSTEWFRGQGNEQSVDRKLKTTGHILEWLLYAASEKELKHWKTAKAANYLANIMHSNRRKDWEAGPLGHAIHALLLYDRLVFKPYDNQNPLPVAGKSVPSASAHKKR